MCGDLIILQARLNSVELKVQALQSAGLGQVLPG